MNSIRGRQSSDTQHIQSVTKAACRRFAQSLPLPPEHDAQADVQADLKFAALAFAIHQIAQQRGTTLTDQLDTWEAGE